VSRCIEPQRLIRTIRLSQSVVQLEDQSQVNRGRRVIKSGARPRSPCALDFGGRGGGPGWRSSPTTCSSKRLGGEFREGETRDTKPSDISEAMRRRRHEPRPESWALRCGWPGWGVLTS